MTPTNQRKPRDPATIEALVGGMQAVRLVMADLERLSANVVWEAKPQARGYAIGCVMQAAKEFAAALKRCGAQERPAPAAEEEQPSGMGPDCKPGYHEEFGICVPDV